MSHLGRARAIRAGALAAVIAGAVIIALGSGAGAAPVPFPAGTTTFRFSSATTITASKSTITLTGQMAGTSDGKGNVTFPASGVKINPTSLVELGKTVTVTSVANGTTTATIDTTTGLVTLTGSITQTLNLSALLPADTACVIGPVAQKFEQREQRREEVHAFGHDRDRDGRRVGHDTDRRQDRDLSGRCDR